MTEPQDPISISATPPTLGLSNCPNKTGNRTAPHSFQLGLWIVNIKGLNMPTIAEIIKEEELRKLNNRFNTDYKRKVRKDKDAVQK